MMLCYFDEFPCSCRIDNDRWLRRGITVGSRTIFDHLTPEPANTLDLFRIHIDVINSPATSIWHG